MKVRYEEIKPDTDSSFRILLTPGLNDFFYWHFHPEYEIVYVEAKEGTRHIGDHISRYRESDLVFVGPNIPHLNFDYGVHTDCSQVIVQMKEDFLGREFLDLPELKNIRQLFEKARQGLSFYGETKSKAAEILKRLPGMVHFEQLIALLHVFQLMAISKEVTELDSRPVNERFLGRDQERMNTIHRFIEGNYHRNISVNEMAAMVHLSTAAFCRYFKKTTRMTFTDFLNQYRVNQARKMLLHDKNVTEACFESGFENLSYFSRTFKRFSGENPSQFRKKLATH